MASPSPASQSNVPAVSLVIYVAAENAIPSTVRAAVRQAQVPTTWIIDQPRQAKMLADTPAIEFGAAVAARSPQRLRSELANLQAGVQATANQSLCVVAGDPQQLRSRASLLANLGIRAVVADGHSQEVATTLRQLPCGLWQFDPSIGLPGPRRRWSFLPTRQPSLRQLVDDDANSPRVLAINLGQANAHDEKIFTQLMQEAAQASRDQALRVVTIGDLANQLTNQHEVKPQRSILRRAA